MTLPLLAALACAVVLLVGAPVLALARRAGLVDVPTARSSHARPVARAGGLLLGLGIAVSLLLYALRTEAGGAAGTYCLAATYLGLGLLDDIWRLRTRTKVVAQALLAACAVALGWRWAGAASEPFAGLPLGAASAPMSWLWIFAVVVLVNFMDGIDLITCAIAAVLLGAGAGAGAGPDQGALFAAALGATLGLAWWNATPARTFPGDGAAHLLGFLVALLPLTQGDTHSVALPWVWASAPLLVAVIDVGWVLARKAMRGVPMGRAHREHMHQRLTRAGWTHAASALRYGVLAFLALILVARVAAQIGIAASFALGALVLAVHLATALHRTRHLPYASLERIEDRDQPDGNAPEH